MSCCGHKREQAVAVYAPVRSIPFSGVSGPRAAVAAASAPATATTNGPATKLRYTGVAPIQVKGPRTGRNYVFSGNAPEVPVDRRDSDALMRIGLFRRAG
jgi:hypothetical protein